MVSRETWWLDLLILLGLLLIGAGLWVWFGLAAAMMYAGTALIVVGIILATNRRVGASK